MTGKTKVFHPIQQLPGRHLEPGVAVDDAVVAEVKGALRACARFAHRTGAGAV